MRRHTRAVYRILVLWQQGRLEIRPPPTSDFLPPPRDKIQAYLGLTDIANDPTPPKIPPNPPIPANEVNDE